MRDNNVLLKERVNQGEMMYRDDGTVNDYLKELNGTEVMSLDYEGTVYIKDGYVYMDGNKVEKLTKKKAKALFDEMFYNEFGTNDINALLTEEFG